MMCFKMQPAAKKVYFLNINFKLGPFTIINIVINKLHSCNILIPPCFNKG